MVIPRIQEPSELSDRVVALRFRRAPGPYPLKEDWEQDLDMIYPGIKVILESYAPRKYGKPMYGETNESETLLLASVVRWYGSHFGKRLNCVDIVRRMAGETSGHRASPGTIRGDYSIDNAELANALRRPFRNLIHASGDESEARNELDLWFDVSEICDDYLRADQKIMFRA